MRAGSLLGFAALVNAACSVDSQVAFLALPEAPPGSESILVAADLPSRGLLHAYPAGMSAPVEISLGEQEDAEVELIFVGQTLDELGFTTAGAQQSAEGSFISPLPDGLARHHARIASGRATAWEEVTAPVTQIAASFRVRDVGACVPFETRSIPLEGVTGNPSFILPIDDRRLLMGYGTALARGSQPQPTDDALVLIDDNLVPEKILPSPAEVRVRSGAIIDEGRMVFGSEDGKLYLGVLDLSGSAPVLRLELLAEGDPEDSLDWIDGGPTSSVAFDVFALSKFGALYSFDGNQLELLQRFPNSDYAQDQKDVLWLSPNEALVTTGFSAEVTRYRDGTPEALKVPNNQEGLSMVQKLEGVGIFTSNAAGELFVLPEGEVLRESSWKSLGFVPGSSRGASPRRVLEIERGLLVGAALGIVGVYDSRHELFCPDFAAPSVPWNVRVMHPWSGGFIIGADRPSQGSSSSLTYLSWPDAPS